MSLPQEEIEDRVGQLQFFMLGELSGADVSPVVRRLAPRLNDLERRALSMADCDDVDQTLAAQVRRLLGASVVYRELVAELESPMASLPDLVRLVRRCQEMLAENNEQREQLSVDDLGMPPGQDQWLGRYRDTSRRFLRAMEDVAARVDRLTVMDEELFGQLYTAAYAGEVPPHWSPAMAPDQILESWELDAFSALRAGPAPAAPSPEMVRWCMLWTTLVVCRRMWVVWRLSVPRLSKEALLAVARDAAVTATQACEVMAATADKVPLTLGFDLERSTVLLLDFLEAFITEDPHGIVTLGLREKVEVPLFRARQKLVATVQKHHSKDPVVLTEAGDLVQKRVRTMSLAIRVRRVTRALRHRATRRLTRMVGSRHRARAIRIGAAVSLVLALLVGWTQWLGPRLKVEELGPGDLQAVGSQLRSGYLVRKGEGRAMVAIVSTRWAGMEPADRRRLVDGLLAVYAPRGVNELMLRDVQGRVVAQYRDGKLTMMP